MFLEVNPDFTGALEFGLLNARAEAVQIGLREQVRGH
jgi:hypothetical protein